MLGWEKATMMIVTHEEVLYEDRKREKESGRERETERNLCNEDILTVFTPPPGLHTSGTEWSMADRRRPVDILEKKTILFIKKKKTNIHEPVSESESWKIHFLTGLIQGRFHTSQSGP